MKVTNRVQKGSKIRKENMVPGVLYGKGIESVSVQAELTDVVKTLKKYGTSMTFEVSIDKVKHLVYIKDFQTDYLNNFQVTHFDLLKVSKEDTLTSHVHIDFINREQVQSGSQVLNLNLTELEIEYHVGQGVSSIEVDLLPLKTKTAMKVKDVVVPKGVKILNNPEQIVANMTSASSFEEPLEGEEVAEVLEVESIKQKDE